MDASYERNLWYGLLTENYISAVARDIFADKLLKLESAGYKVVLHAHDEFVVEVPELKAKECQAEIEKIMIADDIEWMPKIPLAVESEIADCYKK